MAYDRFWEPGNAPFRVGAEGRDGIGRMVFRSRRFRAPTRGVRIRAVVPLDLPTRCASYALVLPEDTAFAGPTATRLWRAPVPWRFAREGAELVAVVDARTGRHPERAGIRTQRVLLGPHDVVLLDGVRVTSPERTFRDMAALLPLPDLVAVGDVLLRRRLATRESLAREVASARGARGIRRARRALVLLDPRAESPQESRLRLFLAEAGLPPPEPNGVIRDADGEFLARGDLVWRVAKVVAEYDGLSHLDPQRRARDAARRSTLRENGWWVVELTAADLRNPDRAVDRVTAALSARGALRVPAESVA